MGEEKSPSIRWYLACGHRMGKDGAVSDDASDAHQGPWVFSGFEVPTDLPPRGLCNFASNGPKFGKICGATKARIRAAAWRWARGWVRGGSGRRRAGYHRTRLGLAAAGWAGHECKRSKCRPQGVRKSVIDHSKATHDLRMVPCARDLFRHASRWEIHPKIPVTIELLIFIGSCGNRGYLFSVIASLTRIFLIRHGATTLSAEDRFAGATDVPLSDEGRRQAMLLGERLSGVGVTNLLSVSLSPSSS